MASQLSTISSADALGLLLGLDQSSSPLALKNVVQVKEVLRTFNGDLASITFAPNDTIVMLGSTNLDLPTDLAYAEVPLGLILSGEAVVTKNGKATKRLTVGDFVGLFETSDYISTKKRRHIGDWVVTTHTGASILYFTEQFITASRAFSEYLLALARNDPVPQPITSMQLLDFVASHTTHRDFKDYAILAHTHFLPSNVPLFRHLAHLVGPNRMFVIDKPYSTVPSVTKELITAGYEVTPVKLEHGVPYSFAIQKSLTVLWDTVVESYHRGDFSKLLILDDGADLWLSIPHERLSGLRLAGVEQTQRGITRLNAAGNARLPVVSVASSGVKKIVESSFIGQSVADKMQRSGLFNNEARIGVVGSGSIGSAVARSALKAGCTVGIYDPAIGAGLGGTTSVVSLDVLLNEYDVIVGTTGTDCLRGVALERVKGKKILLSASSSDIEFGSLLKIAGGSGNPFGPISVQAHDELNLTILNGGFPFNFDRLGNATDEHDIVLTRCLLYAGMMQAADALEDGVSGGVYELDRISQEHILSNWLVEKGKMGEVVDESLTGVQRIVETTVREPGGVLPTIWKD